jgi:TolA-binding protein
MPVAKGLRHTAKAFFIAGKLPGPFLARHATIPYLFKTSFITFPEHMKHLGLLTALTACLIWFGSPSNAQDSKENADFKLAVNLYNDGLYDLAAEQLRQFVNTYQTSPQAIEARFYLGLTQLKLKRLEDARSTFQTFALNYQDNPHAAEAWVRAGEAYAALGNLKEAALAFERAKVFHPKDKVASDALLQAAKYFMAAGQREDARRVLKVILSEYASSAASLPARTMLGRMYFEDGNAEQAMSELKRVIDGDPSPEARAQALLILGSINQSSHKSGQATENYQEILTKYKSSAAAAGAMIRMGSLSQENGKFSEAIDHFKKGLAVKAGLDSSLTKDAYLGLAASYAALKDDAAALSTLDRFITSYASDKRIGEVLWQKALTAARLRKFSVSSEACSRILKLQDSPLLVRRAMIRIAKNSVEQQNLVAAVEQYQQFVNQYPDDAAAPEVLFQIGQLYETKFNDMRRAVLAYETVAGRYGKSSRADQSLAAAARCHERMKEIDRSRELYADLLARYPGSATVPAARQRLAMIDIFETRDKDAALEKLALVIGDVVQETDKASLAFRLGDIYYNQLRNYEAAAAQFSAAINGGLDGKRLVDAMFLRARSFECLTIRDESFRAGAIEAYQTYLKSNPTDSRAQDAILSLFFLRAVTPATAKAAMAGAIPPGKRDTMFLKVGQLLQAADSLGEALIIYKDLAREYPSTPSGIEASYRIARLLTKVGQPDSADVWDQWYVDHAATGEHCPEALNRLALRSALPDRSILLNRRLMESFWYTPEGTAARERLASALVLGSDPAEGAALYSDLIREQESSALGDNGAQASLLLGLATARQKTGESASARATLMQLLGHAPPPDIAGQAYLMLGWLARNNGNLEEATVYFREAERLKPGAASSKEVADLLFDNGNYADAVRQYVELSKTAKADSDRRYFDMRTIIARLRDNQPAVAEKEIPAFIERYGKDEKTIAAFQLERGNCCFRAEEYDKAMTLFAEVAKKYDETPSAPIALYWVGKTFEAQEKPAEAVAALQELVKNHPGAEILPRAHVALGNLFYGMERWGDAAKEYRTIVDDPKADPALLPMAISNLIETYEISNINDAALALARRYLDLYPNADDSFDKKIKIGILYDKLGYHDQAVIHLQGLLDQAGADLEGELRYYIAEANYNKGDYQQAILDFLKVPYLVTKKGKIDWTANSLYMSGQAYEKLNKFDQALTMYQQIIDRKGIDENFKIAAKKEIDRVNLIVKKGAK